MSTEDNSNKVSFEDLDIEPEEKVRPTAPSEAVAIDLGETTEPKRKVFANKKANIALIIVGAVALLGIIAAIIFVLI